MVGSAGRERTGPDRRDPEVLAFRALAFVAAEPSRLERFLVQSGIRPGAVREAAESPRFFFRLVSHIAADRRLSSGFAVFAGIAPDAVLDLRDALAPRPLPDQLTRLAPVS